jgi:hypothetical protein
MTSKNLEIDFKSHTFSTHDKSIVVDLYTVFGWKVHKHTMPAGSILINNTLQTIPRNKCPNKAMYVKGRATILLNNTTYLDERVPGMCTLERPDPPQGTAKITAVEEVEYWCFNYSANKRALPDLIPIRINAGSSYTFEKDNLIFIMSGTIDTLTGPCEFVPEANTTLQALTNTYAFRILEAKV